MEPASHPVALGNKEQALVTTTEHRKGLTCKEALSLPKDTGQKASALFPPFSPHTHYASLCPKEQEAPYQQADPSRIQVIVLGENKPTLDSL